MDGLQEELIRLWQQMARLRLDGLLARARKVGLGEIHQAPAIQAARRIGNTMEAAAAMVELDRLQARVERLEAGYGSPR